MTLPHRRLAYRFVLPLACAPTGNNIHQGIRAGLKRKAYEIMLQQLLEQGGTVDCALQPGCLVRCTRYSSRQPDSVDGNKIPIDRLLPSQKKGRVGKTQGLGIITDDSPVYISRVDRWVYAPPKDGRFELEIFYPSNWFPEQFHRVAVENVGKMNRRQLCRLLDSLEER